MPDRTTLGEDFFIAPTERDGAQMVRDASRRVLPKRFYASAEVAPHAGGFAVHLDGRPIRTPLQNQIVLPTRAAADLVAAEWSAQGDHIDPTAMPVTRLVNSALDGVASNPEGVADDIVKYAGSDLVCYRAGEPLALVAAQANAWDPVLAFARDDLGARMIVVEGISFAQQSEEAIAAVRRAVEQVSGGPSAILRLAALHTITTLTGSALIALAFAYGRLSCDSAWAAAHVDEDEQMRVWGLDTEALRRRAARLTEMRAACDLFAAIEGP